MPARFLQLHYLTSYPAALLNRDDAGFAKRIPFGGAVRTRVSSQCLKRHWRSHQGEHALSLLGVAPSVRSRLTFEKHIVEPLVDEGVPENLARAVTEALMAEVLGKSAKRQKAESDEKDEKKEASESLQTGQITVLGRPEIEYLLGEARAVCKATPDVGKAKAAVEERLAKHAKKNLQALKHAAGIDAALFGRMVTSDPLARGDAAVHVAHALTVHEEASESDYFSAVDDLLKTPEEEQLGSGHIGTSELTSGLFYGYVALDVPLLVSNLEGEAAKDSAKSDRTLAARVAESLVHLVATVSPGAKLGSTAPHAYAHAVIVEAGDAQPRTLANAFLRPVSERPDLVANTYDALARHVSELDRMYGRRTERRVAAIGPADGLRVALGASELETLDALARWAAGRVRGAADA